MNNQKGFVGVIVLVVVGVIVLGVAGAVLASAMNLITIPWLKFDSQVQMNRDIVTKTYNADNAIYNYHWFQERATAIDALDKTIVQADAAVASFEASAGARSTWASEDRTEDSRLRSVAQGQRAQYNSLVGEYNARAKEVDRNIFQNNLPLFFNLKPY